MAGNKSLNAAIKAKQDEFYTQLPDIEDELKHYKRHFEGKTIFCNCDDPYESNFFKYFAMNFNQLGLKKLIATCYDGSPIADKQLSLSSCDDSFDIGKTKENTRTGVPHKIIISEVTDLNGDGAINLADVEYLLKNNKNVLTELEGNGDFRSKECVELLEEADIVVTNPPFSLFREFISLLMKYDKKFLVIGNQNNVTYKELFPLIMQNKVWSGVNYGGQKFEVPMTFERNNTYIDKTDGKKYAKFGNICWFTNLDHKKRHEDLDMYMHYSESEYKKYDNYDAIDIEKISDIPMDYDGVMGVPITFVFKYNPEQFEILGITDRGNEYGLKTKEYTKVDSVKYSDLNRRGVIKVGETLKSTFAKLLIRKKQ